MIALHTNTQRGVWYGSQGPQRKGRKHFGADDRSLAEHSSRLTNSRGVLGTDWLFQTAHEVAGVAPGPREPLTTITGGAGA